MFFKRKEVVESTAFSRFVREASSEQKKRVFTDVLRKASDRQNRVVESAAQATGMFDRNQA